MHELFEMVDSRISKQLNKSTFLKSAPCRVINVLDNGTARVRLISNGAEYTVDNYSGSQINIGETVQLFYKDRIDSGGAYIGASEYKKENGEYESEISDNVISAKSTWSSQKINIKINELQNRIDDLSQSTGAKITSGIIRLHLAGTDMYTAGKTMLIEEDSE